MITALRKGDHAAELRDQGFPMIAEDWRRGWITLPNSAGTSMIAEDWRRGWITLPNSAGTSMIAEDLRHGSITLPDSVISEWSMIAVVRVGLIVLRSSVATRPS
jgi:hypothetical protein